MRLTRRLQPGPWCDIGHGFLKALFFLHFARHQLGIEQTLILARKCLATVSHRMQLTRCLPSSIGAGFGILAQSRFKHA